jgi:PhnB protein
MASPKPIPDGYTTVTPSLVFTECAKAIAFYKQALGAQELARIPGPDGKIVHAEIKVGNAHVMLSDEIMGAKSAQSLGGSPVGFYLYVEDADGAFRQATAAGCKPIMPVADMFWGDRMGVVSDPFGFKWNFATRVKELTPDEMKKGQDEWMKQMAGAQ